MGSNLPSLSTFHSVLPVEPRASGMWGKCFTTELHPSTAIQFLCVHSKEVFHLYVGSTTMSTLARCQWFMPVTPGYSGAEIRTIKIWSQPKKIVQDTLSWKNPSQKGLVEWLKVQALSLNPSTAKLKKKSQCSNPVRQGLEPGTRPTMPRVSISSPGALPSMEACLHWPERGPQ
jgi:hypothetical protein